MTCFFLSLPAASRQRKIPRGKRKRRLVNIMKLPAAPRQQRSLLNTPQTHKQVRAGEKTPGCVCVCSFVVPAWTLTWVVQMWWLHTDRTGLYYESGLASVLALAAEVGVGEQVFFLFFFPEETEEPTFSGRTIWLSSSCLQSPLWHSFLSESLTGKICVPFNHICFCEAKFHFDYGWPVYLKSPWLNEQRRLTGTFIVIIKRGEG